MYSADKVYLDIMRRDYSTRKPKMYLTKEPEKKKDENDEEESDWEEDEDWEENEESEEDDDWEEDDDDW